MGTLSFQSAMTLFFLVFLWGPIGVTSLLDLEKTRLNAKEISRELHDALEENVGKKHLEKAYKTMSCSTVSQAMPGELLEEMVASAEHRFNQTLRVLMESKASVIDQAAARNNTRGRPYGAISLQDCCNALPGSLTAYNPRFRGEVNSSVACEKLHASNPKNMTNGDDLLETFSKNVELAETVSWQYFGSSQGYYLQYPSSTRVCNTSNTYDPRFTSWYVNAASRARTNMVLIIDISGSMNRKGRMELARQAALTVLDTLGADDSVGVLAFSNAVSTPRGCFGSVVAQANPTNINQLKEWVKQLSPVGGTKYVPAFIRAFEMLASKRTAQTPNVASVILFLTDGQPWETDDAIFNAIRKGQTNVQNRTIINTYGLGDGIKYDDLERLRKIAEQNGGTSVQIRDADAFKLRTIMGQYYAQLPGTTRDDPVISLPRIVNNLGLVTTMSAACLAPGSNDIMGVVAQDVIVAELVKEVVEFSSSSGLSYAALIDRKGRTIIHPNVPKPNEHIVEPVFQSLSLYEPGMKNGTLQRMTSGLPGSTAMMAYMSSSRGDPDTDGATTVVMNATYTWRLIQGSPYIVVLVTAEGTVETNEKYKFIAQHPSVKSYYHRLDLTVNKTALAPPSVCNMDGHLVSKQFSTVKFAPEAFNDSSLFVSTPETVQEVISLANFFNDLSTQNTHQGLSKSARVEVMLTAQPERHWNESKHRDPEAAQWRFVATEGGVFRVFPGIRLQKTYSHKKQPWYRRAIVNAGRLTISRPSTNNSALQSPGSMLSMVTTFDAMRCRTSEPLSSQIAGVVGFQLSLVSLHKILTRVPKLCDTLQQDCFIIDNSGYILSDVLNPQTNAFRHVTQVFPWLAASWASSGNIVKTSWCNNLEKHKVQLFHSLVLPRDGTSSVNGTEPCRQYVIANLPDTNAYLLVLRSRTMYGCDENADIRECNQCEAQCANCTGHISPCQCPCSCSMSYDKCTNSITGLWTGIPCPVSVPKSLDTSVGVKTNNIALLNVPLCPKPCDSLLEEDECNASNICHWCRFSAVPFCGSVCRTDSRTSVLILFPCNNFIELSLTQNSELKKSFKNTLSRIVPQLKPIAFDVTTMDKTGISITLHGTTDGIPVSHLRDQIMLAVERERIVIGPTANVTQIYTAMSVKSYTNLRVQLFMSPWPDSGFSEEQTLFEVTKVLQKALDSLLGTSLASQARNVSLTKSAIIFYLTNEGKTSSYSITRIENRLKTAVNNSELFIQVPPHEKPWFARNISTASSFSYFCQRHPTDSTVTPSTVQMSTDGDSHHTALPPRTTEPEQVAVSGLIPTEIFIVIFSALGIASCCPILFFVLRKRKKTTDLPRSISTETILEDDLPSENSYPQSPTSPRAKSEHFTKGDRPFLSRQSTLDAVKVVPEWSEMSAPDPRPGRVGNSPRRDASLTLISEHRASIVSSQEPKVPSTVSGNHSNSAVRRFDWKESAHRMRLNSSSMQSSCAPIQEYSATGNLDATPSNEHQHGVTRLGPRRGRPNENTTMVSHSLPRKNPFKQNYEESDIDTIIADNTNTTRKTRLNRSHSNKNMSMATFRILDNRRQSLQVLTDARSIAKRRSLVNVEGLAPGDFDKTRGFNKRTGIDRANPRPAWGKRPSLINRSWEDTL